MKATYELFPFHEDAAIAAALRTLFVQHDSAEPNPIAEIADRFNVDSEQLGNETGLVIDHHLVRNDIFCIEEMFSESL